MPLASTSKIRIMEYKDQKYTYLGGLIHGISTLATGKPIINGMLCCLWLPLLK